ncbi:hypothetical protein D3C73_1224960 [compost metagenome]
MELLHSGHSNRIGDNFTVFVRHRPEALLMRITAITNQLRYGQPVRCSRILRQNRQLAGYFFGRQRMYRLAVQHHAAALRLHNPGHRLKNSRFPGAVSAYQRCYFSCGERQVQLFHNRSLCIPNA